MVRVIFVSRIGRNPKLQSPPMPSSASRPKAVELDPTDLMTNFRLVQANYYARRYDEAARAGRIAIELTPDSPYTYFYVALSLEALRLKEEAWEWPASAESLPEACRLARAISATSPES
jgi:tetratricopeptide (TPR) repeat protein